METARVMTAVRSLLLALLFGAGSAGALEIGAVWMTGRWPVEATPLQADLDGDGTPELVAVTRGGEVLHWRLDGTPIGTGVDGVAARLPDGAWSSSPALIAAPGGLLIVACNGNGLVVALGPDLQERWRHELGGPTRWGGGVPAVVPAENGPLMVFSVDQREMVALDTAGNLAWKAQGKLSLAGPRANVVTLRDGSLRLLAPLGAGLACLSTDGQVQWATELPGSKDYAKGVHPGGPPMPVVISAPRLLSMPDREMIVCVADGGIVAALDTAGALLWTLEFPGELNDHVSFYTQPDGTPLILVTELFGNLHAITPEGKRVWSHVFRSKNRGAPQVFDTDGDGEDEIVVATYAQHVLAFNHRGELVDDLRVNGLANPTLLPIVDASSGREDLFVATAALLAYRLQPSMPRSTYPAGSGDSAVKLGWGSGSGFDPAVRLENSGGRYVLINTVVTEPEGFRTITGMATSRTLVDADVPPSALALAQTLRTEARDAEGRLLGELTVEGADLRGGRPPVPPGFFGIAMRVDSPYEALSDTPRPRPSGASDAVRVEGLYVDEVGAAAFALRSATEESLDIRIDVERPADDSAQPFAGTVDLFRVVSVGAINGERRFETKPPSNVERVADALVPLGPANVLTLPGKGVERVYVRVDTHGSEPSAAGAYKGRITATPLFPGVEAQALPLEVEVLPLRMPEKYPLTLCTWDYVPNQWFPNHTDAVLDDMGHHGVDVFPRAGCLPKGTVDAGGTVTFAPAEMEKLEIELDRLKGRGQLLLQLARPALDFPAPPTPEAQHAAEIAYVRLLRDELKARGWDYDSYAFYPVDEPGLDYQVANVDVLAECATLFREADPRIRVYTDPVPSLSREGFERLEPLIDVWCPNMRMVTGLLAKDPRIERIMASGKPVWSYECVAQVKSLSPLRYNRANAWRGYAFGLDGIGFWTHSQTQKDMWYPSDDEYALVYPGERPVPSLRWEAVRDGLEDVAAMALMKEAIKKRRADGTRSEIVARAEDALRIAQNDILQLSDAAFVESRDYLAKGDRRIWHTDADIETYRRHRETIARLTVELAGL